MHNNAVIILHDIACRLGRGGCGLPRGFMRFTGLDNGGDGPRRMVGSANPAISAGSRTDMSSVYIRPDGSDRPGLPDIPGPSLARASMTLDMDETGRITKRVLTMGPEARTHEYEYDDSGRLTRVKEDGQDTEIYEYCDLGRRIASTSIPRAVHGRQYEYDAEGRLTKAGKTSYEYDAYGNLAAKREGPHGMLETRYYHTPRGEMLRVELPRQQGGKVVDYQLDPQGRRAAKAIDGRVTERYQWLDRLRLKAVLDAQGNPKAIFLYDQSGSRLPIGMRTESGELRFFQDQVGTLVAILDENEEILTTLEHDSFGNRLGESNHRVTPYLGFCSGLHDRDTNLVLFGYRNYDPDVGRFISPDPLGYTGGDPGDMYEYCVDDPIHASDRTGLWGDSLFGGKKKEGSGSGGWWKGNVKKTEEKRWLGNVGNAVANVAASAAKVAGPGQWLRGVGGAGSRAAGISQASQWLRGVGDAVASAVDFAMPNPWHLPATRDNLHTTVGPNAGWWKQTAVRQTPWHEDSPETRKRKRRERGLAFAHVAKSDSKEKSKNLYSTKAASSKAYIKGVEQMENQYKFADWVEEQRKIGSDWVGKLPCCPCEFPGNVKNEWMVSTESPKKYHPGATNCIRSVDKEEKYGGSGQQCCYDENGKLITGGRGAGTPDIGAPFGRPYVHYNQDVLPSEWSANSIDPNGYVLYNRFRPPSNCGCPENIK